MNYGYYPLCRFFVVEDTILHTTQSLTKTGVGDEGLVTRKIVHDFWSMAQDEALAVLRNNCVSLCSISYGGYNVMIHVYAK